MFLIVKERIKKSLNTEIARLLKLFCIVFVAEFLKNQENITIRILLECIVFK